MLTVCSTRVTLSYLFFHFCSFTTLLKLAVSQILSACYPLASGLPSVQALWSHVCQLSVSVGYDCVTFKLNTYASSPSRVMSYDNTVMIHWVTLVGLIRSISVQRECSSCLSMRLSHSASLGSANVQDMSMQWLQCPCCWQSCWEVIYSLALHQIRPSLQSTTSQVNLKMRSGSLLRRDTDIPQLMALPCLSDECLMSVTDCAHPTLSYMSCQWLITRPCDRQVVCSFPSSNEMYYSLCRTCYCLICVQCIRLCAL